MTAPVSPPSVAGGVVVTEASGAVVVPIRLVPVPRRPLTPATLPWSTA